MINNRRKICYIILTGFFLVSCQTKTYILKSKDYHLDTSRPYVVLENKTSFVLPDKVFPPYQNIDVFVVGKKPAFYRIDSLICQELARRKMKCEIVDSLNFAAAKDKYFITYADYWTWDFKDYMHLLKVRVLDENKNVIVIGVSEGNTAGMHDAPMPQKQVPVILDLIMKGKE